MKGKVESQSSTSNYIHLSSPNLAFLFVVTEFLKQADPLKSPYEIANFRKTLTVRAFLSPYLIDEEIDCENSYSLLCSLTRNCLKTYGLHYT